MLLREVVAMVLHVELEQEDDGRWIAEITDLPGALCYGASEEEARARVQALALRILADRLEHGEAATDLGPRMLARISKKTGLTPEDL